MSLYENPGVCPNCRTESIRTYTLDPVEHYQYIRRCKCNHCGCEWSEIYAFERKRVDKEGRRVKVVDDNGRVFIYTVGEVFRHDVETFYCTTDGRGIVQYLRIDEPIDDMMFRASDGKLYQYLCDPDQYGTSVCACEAGKLTCDVIQQELFGRGCAKGEIWIPVDEGN